MVIGGSVVTYREIAAYVGPGDIVSGASGWWGLRAYSAATIGDNAIRLRRSGDNAEQDFATIAGGGLDLAAINSFKGAANLFVVTLYDQSGNANHRTQSSASIQPSFSLAALGSHPVINGNGTSLELGENALGATIPQPFSVSFVLFNTTPSLGAIMGATAYVSETTTTNITLYCGTTQTNAMSTNAWHAVQEVANGASSVIAVDGVDGGAISPGTNSIPNNETLFLLRDGFGFWHSGMAVEWGVWPAGFSSGNRTAMDANQAAYWGY